ncbi:MAG: rhodanese-like domain-containing protein, partial [Blautia sp.]|nr:rhodanese-like domain-containing protein [Blautia sp.]
MKHIIPILLVLAMCVTGIVTFADESGYTQIDQDRAKEMMTREDGHIVVDVRRQDEYDAGHIPGAIL